MHQQISESAKRAAFLTPLTSIRFFAAFHIFLFHLDNGHEQHRLDAAASLSFPAFDLMPAALLNWIQHGYCSTSLFFVLSGFILTFVYVDGQGRRGISTGRFWVSRFARVYPLHVAVLLLIAAGMILTAHPLESNRFDLVTGGVLSATLLQAWFPRFALSWNYPTWAISAIAFFYIMFPVLTRYFAGQSRRQLVCLMAIAFGISLVPSVLYLLADLQPGPAAGFWREVVMRSPLLWLPQFALGMMLSRVTGIHRYDTAWRDPGTKSVVSWGDVALACVLLIEISGIAIPRFLLRHGLLTPLYLIVIYDLAKNRGLAARLLSLPGLKTLGEASFALFVLQYPIHTGMKILMVHMPLPAGLPLLLAVVIAVGASLASTFLFEQPVANWLRTRYARPRADAGREPQSGEPTPLAPGLATGVLQETDIFPAMAPAEAGACGPLSGPAAE